MRQRKTFGISVVSASRTTLGGGGVMSKVPLYPHHPCPAQGGVLQTRTRTRARLGSNGRACLGPRARARRTTKHRAFLWIVRARLGTKRRVSGRTRLGTIQAPLGIRLGVLRGGGGRARLGTRGRGSR